MVQTSVKRRSAINIGTFRSAVPAADGVVAAGEVCISCAQVFTLQA